MARARPSRPPRSPPGWRPGGSRRRCSPPRCRARSGRSGSRRPDPLQERPPAGPGVFEVGARGHAFGVPLGGPVEVRVQSPAALAVAARSRLTRHRVAGPDGFEVRFGRHQARAWHRCRRRRRRAGRRCGRCAFGRGCAVRRRCAGGGSQWCFPCRRPPAAPRAGARRWATVAPPEAAVPAARPGAGDGSAGAAGAAGRVVDASGRLCGAAVRRPTETARGCPRREHASRPAGTHRRQRRHARRRTAGARAHEISACAAGPLAAGARRARGMLTNEGVAQGRPDSVRRKRTP